MVGTPVPELVDGDGATEFHAEHVRDEGRDRYTRNPAGVTPVVWRGLRDRTHTERLIDSTRECPG